MAEIAAVRGVRSRYLLAAAFILLFVFVLFIAEKLTYLMITDFFPSLTPDIHYVAEVFRIILAILGSYIVYKILVSIANLYGTQRNDPATSEVLKKVLRVLFYFVAITIILTTTGINLSTALAGGAIGGIVLGLAVQTVTTSILSGVLISSSRTLKPGDLVILHSLTWGDVLCKIKRVSIMFTDAITHDGLKIRFPNTLLFSSTVFTSLENNGGYSYPFEVTVRADVPMSRFEGYVNSILKSKFAEIGHETPEVYLFLRRRDKNIFNVVLKFKKFEEINSLVNLVNVSFDLAYWSIKKGSKTGTKT